MNTSARSGALAGLLASAGLVLAVQTEAAGPGTPSVEPFEIAQVLDQVPEVLDPDAEAVDPDAVKDAAAKAKGAKKDEEERIRREVEKQKREAERAQREAEKQQREQDRAAAEAEKAQREAEKEKREDDRARAEAEKAKREADRARAIAEKQKSEDDRARAEAEKGKREIDRAKAEAEKAKREVDRINAEAGKQKQEADRAKADAEKDQRDADRAKADAEKANAAAEKAKRDKDSAQGEADKQKQEADRTKADAEKGQREAETGAEKAKRDKDRAQGEAGKPKQDAGPAKADADKGQREADRGKADAEKAKQGKDSAQGEAEKKGPVGKALDNIFGKPAGKAEREQARDIPPGPREEEKARVEIKQLKDKGEKEYEKAKEERRKERQEAKGERREGRDDIRERRIEVFEKKFDDLRDQRREHVEDGGRRIVIEEPDKRRIIRDRESDRVIIRHDETARIKRSARDVRVERRRDGSTANIVVRPGGVEIITIVDNDGRLLKRLRRGRDGREVVIIDNRPERQARPWRWRHHDRGRRRPYFDVTVNLPPPVVRIPRNKYVVDYEDSSEDGVYEALSAPPVERLDRGYTLDQVRRSWSLRERMRRVDLDAINFEFGSWEVENDQYPKLEWVADAIKRVLERNPDEVFLIEGHTDAVGSDVDNLSLSDRRAESVAVILTDVFGVGPENLVTQGYGEEFLKIDTPYPERQNRRVALRRITPLLSRAGRRDDDRSDYDEDRDRDRP